jgi:hypothetical protein
MIFIISNRLKFDHHAAEVAFNGILTAQDRFGDGTVAVRALGRCILYFINDCLLNGNNTQTVDP